MNWKVNLIPYVQVVEELKIKLKGMRKQFEEEQRHSPIEFITERVKTVDRIKEKAYQRNIPMSDVACIEDSIDDIAGRRIVCQFVDDIYTVVEMLQYRKDFCINAEQDYIE